MGYPSMSLASWAKSWLAGEASPDDLVDALHEWAPLHVVRASDPVVAGRVGIEWPDPEIDGITVLIKTIRAGAGGTAGGLRLILPAPGDVRGLPPGTGFASAALAAGEGVLLGTGGAAGTGIVPTPSGADVLEWSCFDTPIPLAVDDETLGDIEYRLRAAVRDAADVVASVHRTAIANRDFDVRGAIEDELAELHHHRLPESLSPRARRVLDSADQLAAILTVAKTASVSSPTSLSANTIQDETLRPLWDAIRLARMAAVNSGDR
ncbi:hypothetical protein FOS14_18480 [Skermania sp. ID1734]|uniref:hypothetical protein n=1 Tax=Skermania sp. ID1734 TaxID=2597516 RepID=UPI00117C3DB6|nr:hypothetical protein [Skermania sp. ID1734]TSD95345.1 hypothetical protein FOS14_18480 [Skermania sp. ID1734]